VRERLADASRPGAVPRLSAEQVCQIVALACEQPSGSGRPISHWSDRELADEIVRRGITDRISPPPRGTVAQKRPICSHIECGIGSPRPTTPTATQRSLT
jgi:putative transposase